MVKGPKILGYVVLFIGITLLVFTVINLFPLLGIISLLSIQSLIEICIRSIFLIIMGWIGYTLTRKGIEVIKHT